MMRALPAVAGLGAALALAACGSGSSAATTGAKSTPSPQARGQGNGLRRNGAAGEVVQLGSTSLVLNTTTGDVTVDFSSSTPVSRTHTGTLADVATGMCITATGQKDATGAVTAATVILNAKVNGSCRGPLGFGGPGGAPDRSPGATPRPTFTPRPGTPPVAFARGEITAVSGTSVTVLAATGTSTTITVPTTARISVVDSASTADLTVGDCVLATGQKNSSGVVTARSLNVVPAGPSGCFTGGGFGGFGGFRGGGGGGFGGGGGGFGGSGGGGGGG